MINPCLRKSFRFQDGQYLDSGLEWWCSGFFPGSLWYVYEYTSDDKVKELAHKHTVKMKSLVDVYTDHDIGFQANCSFGNAYRLTRSEEYLPGITPPPASRSDSGDAHSKNGFPAISQMEGIPKWESLTVHQTPVQNYVQLSGILPWSSFLNQIGKSFGHWNYNTMLHFLEGIILITYTNITLKVALLRGMIKQNLRKGVNQWCYL